MTSIINLVLEADRENPIKDPHTWTVDCFVSLGHTRYLLKSVAIDKAYNEQEAKERALPLIFDLFP